LGNQCASALPLACPETLGVHPSVEGRSFILRCEGLHPRKAFVRAIAVPPSRRLASHQLSQTVIAGWLIQIVLSYAQAMENRGWNIAYVVLGLVCLLLSVPQLFHHRYEYFDSFE
jgi:hypothetical protein